MPRPGELVPEGLTVLAGLRPLRSVLQATSVVSVLFGVGACQSRLTDHSADITQLVETGPRTPRKATSGFELVGAKERSGLPVGPPKPYLLGVGDVVDVKLLLPTNQPMLEGTLTGPIKEDGSLYLPVVRKVEAKDKTALEVETEITERLKEYVQDPIVSVEVAQFRARKARVVGEGVEVEQYLPVDGKLTLLSALIQAGATRKPMADREEAYLIRDQKVHPFSINAMVGRGDPSGDFVLAEGDHIVVPSLRDRQDFVYVLGQVLRPGRFEMDHKGRPGYQGRMTLMGAIGQAGGVLEATADCDRVCIFRGSWNTLKVYTLAVPDLYRDGEAIYLEPGDRIYVASSDFAKFNMGLNQFLPFLSGIGNSVSLGLSAKALIDAND